MLFPVDHCVIPKTRTLRRRAGCDAVSGLRPVGIHNILALWFMVSMDRHVLTDARWAKMEPHCLGKPTDPGRGGRNNRLFVEAVLWIARTGSPWRDLPAHFGKEFKRIAMRACKTDQSFSAMVHRTAAVINSR